MSTEQIEERLARLEREMAELRERIEARDRPWWERLPKIDPQMFDEMQPYSEYIRQTGDAPPDDWKPGDPIPEPDYWK